MGTDDHRGLTARAQAQARKLDEARALLRHVADNGGTLHLGDPDATTRAWYRRLLATAKVHGLVPAGYHLLHTGRDRGDLIIRLCDATRPDTTGWNRIRLSTRRDIRDPHEITRSLQSDPSFFDLDPRSHQRAVRLVEHLAEQAHAHGHSLVLSGRTDRPRLFLHIGGVRRTVLITRADAPPHRRARQHHQPDLLDFDASDRLAVEVARTRHDSDRWTIDSRPFHEQAHDIIAATCRGVQRERLLQEQHRRDLAQHRRTHAESEPPFTRGRQVLPREQPGDIVVPAADNRDSSSGDWATTVGGEVQVIEEHAPLAQRAAFVEGLLPALRVAVQDLQVPDAELTVVVTGDITGSMHQRNGQQFSPERPSGKVAGITLATVRDYSETVIIIEASTALTVDGVDFDFSIFNTVHVLAHEYCHMVIGRLRAAAGTRPAPPTGAVSHERLGLIMAYEAADDEYRCDLFADAVLSQMKVGFGDNEPQPLSLARVIEDGFEIAVGKVLDGMVHPRLAKPGRRLPALAEISLNDMHDRLIQETEQALILLAHADATATSAATPSIGVTYANHPGMSKYLAAAWQPIRDILDITPVIPSLAEFGAVDGQIQACGRFLQDMWERLGVVGVVTREDSLHLTVTDPIR